MSPSSMKRNHLVFETSEILVVTRTWCEQKRETTYGIQRVVILDGVRWGDLSAGQWQQRDNNQ